MLKTVRSTVNVDQITGVLPVVNGGTGVTTSTGTGSVVLSAAPTLSGNVGLSTGNIVPATAAKGINFTANTPAAGMTSQLLNWYEEGTWTPSMQATTTNPTITYSTQTGVYTRVGRVVHYHIGLTMTSVSGGSGSLFINLPFVGTLGPSGTGVQSVDFCNNWVLPALSAPQQSGTGRVLLYTNNTANIASTPANLGVSCTFNCSGAYFI